MNPDELKQAWKSQAAPSRLTIDPAQLLNEIRRNERHFTSILFRRDLREIGIALLMVPVWIYLGIKLSLPWTWYLCVPALLWIAGFMLADRMRQKRNQQEFSDTLNACVARSLAQVEHQIWLLRNVFWWYLLPPGVAVLAFFSQCAWSARDSAWDAALRVAGPFASTLLVGWFIYWLNQYCVRKELEPRRQELAILLQSLSAEEEAGSSGRRAANRPQSSISTWANTLWIVLLCIATVAASVFAYRLAKPASIAFNAEFSPTAGDAAVTNILVSVRQKHRVPAMAAAVVTSKGLVAVGVVGTRKQGTNVAVTLEDQWHLGSDTKAMTATLVAKLVEQGRLQWDTTLAEVFPDLTARFHAGVRGITVEQLLTHRSGLPPNPSLIRYGGADGRRERLRVLEDELSKAPSHKPGTHYEYSNLGYSIAGAITEKITGKTWEQAVSDEVFVPLGMTSVGFGGTGTAGQFDQPWPHTSDGKPVTMNGPTVDNPPVLSPAGRVHCRIQDWAKFITDQLRGARGEPALLKAESYQKLHTPPAGSEYALGWLVLERPWGGGTVLHHAGDNTMNFANVWLAPRRDFAVLVCINQSGDTAFKASDEAISALIELQNRTREETGPGKR